MPWEKAHLLGFQSTQVSMSLGCSLMHSISPSVPTLRNGRVEPSLFRACE